MLKIYREKQIKNIYVFLKDYFSIAYRISKETKDFIFFNQYKQNIIKKFDYHQIYFLDEPSNIWLDKDCNKNIHVETFRYFSSFEQFKNLPSVKQF